MKKQYYIGLDVHKESIAIAYTFSGSRAEAKYHGTCGGSKLAKELGLKLQDLKICYEAALAVSFSPGGFASSASTAS